MSDEKRPDFVSINGVDITEHVKDFAAFGPAFEQVVEQSFSGLKSFGPITIAGVWDDGRITCSVCRERFTPGPEGTATLTSADTGEAFGIVCPSCGTAMVAPSPDA